MKLPRESSARILTSVSMISWREERMGSGLLNCAVFQNNPSFSGAIRATWHESYGSRSTGGLYHVITRGNDCQDNFHSIDDFAKFLSLLVMQKERLPFYLYAFCLMTNHEETGPLLQFCNCLLLCRYPGPARYVIPKIP
jgi:hypothetical protein